MSFIEPRESSPGDAPEVSPGGAQGEREPAPPYREHLGSAEAEPWPVAVPDSSGERQAALRALRSLEATEARLERNARRDAEDTRAKLVQELLPVLDNLDRTIRAAQVRPSDPAMLEGVRMVRQQLEGVLRGYGVERIEAVGQRFDPSVHEAISMVPVGDPQHHGAVVNQVEPGYRFAGRLLRPAKVGVGKLAAPAVEIPVRRLWR